MTSGLPKRLIEVDLPIKRISEHARREKSIRHGHISTLHIWWARRPLAACRAVVCAALWLDPADPECPDAFRQTVRIEMSRWVKDNLRLLSNESLQRFIGFQKNPSKLDDNKELRAALFDFIADFANWDNSTIKEFLDTSRTLTESAHEALGGASGTKPLVVDPFAGGGAIPLEALRVGADVFANDLNPIPILLNKVVLEYIPKYGTHLADEVHKWGEWIKREAKKELTEFYPDETDGAAPIAYLWARTIRCEGPNCGSEVPLIRSLWLKKNSPAVAFKIVPQPKQKRVFLEVIENAKPADVKEGTVKRSSATCPCCGYTTPADRVRTQFLGRKGGASDARLLAVVTSRPGVSGRSYRVATENDMEIAKTAVARLEKLVASDLGGRALPSEQLPYLRSIFNINLLGVTEWQELFTPRQLLALTTLVRTLERAQEKLRSEGSADISDAISTVLALAIDRQADYGSSLCRWVPAGEFMGNTFGRQALGIIWDFAEANPVGNGSGNFEGALEWVERVCRNIALSNLSVGHVQQASATKHPLPDDSASAVVTDPPYYDSVPYADLSDFFYVWLKRSVGTIHPALFAEDLSPKELEVVQLAERNRMYSYKTKANFEKLMTLSLSEARRVTQPSGIGVVVFAHKTTAAWETMLQAVIDANWIIVASWPIDTEMGARLRAQNSATLSSSVHLVCRPRETADRLVGRSEVGDWRDVLQELPHRIHEWMPRLAEEGVVGADAIFACLGPALEVFSRYSSVEKANGDRVTLGEYLVYVWAAVAKEALAMVFEGADASGFEEDARVTAIWLWTLFAGESTEEDSGIGETSEEDSEAATNIPKGYVLEYDAARKIAQGLGAHLESLTSLVEVKGDIARLLPVAERTRRLFGKEESQTPTKTRKKKSPQLQLGFVAELEQAEEAGGWGSKGAPDLGHTVLDRVHQCMILFAAGRGEALRHFLVDEGVGRDERFWRLAQVLSFLYPKTSDEKRWIDGVLARKKGLGF